MASELQFMECEVERMEEEETEQKNITDELISEKSELSQLFTEQKKNNVTLSQQVGELTEENTSLVDILSTYKEERILVNIIAFKVYHYKKLLSIIIPYS